MSNTAKRKANRLSKRQRILNVLSKNGIEHIPTKQVNLEREQFLKTSRRDFESLREEVDQLKTLHAKRLRICESFSVANKFQQLPESLGALSFLFAFMLPFFTVSHFFSYLFSSAIAAIFMTLFCILTLIYLLEVTQVGWFYAFETVYDEIINAIFVDVETIFLLLVTSIAVIAGALVPQTHLLNYVAASLFCWAVIPIYDAILKSIIVKEEQIQRKMIELQKRSDTTRTMKWYKATYAEYLTYHGDLPQEAKDVALKIFEEVPDAELFVYYPRTEYAIRFDHYRWELEHHRFEWEPKQAYVFADESGIEIHFYHRV